MKVRGQTVLVTGGATGIGLALARRFLAAGSEVVVCGRRPEALAKAKAAHPSLHTLEADLSTAAGRIGLRDEVTKAFPRLGVLVNNAGIQRHVRLADEEPWEETRTEIAINLEAPIHLARLFVPHLERQPSPAIVNVTSGLAFVPAAWAPVYSATKAALHSFTLSLRHQLASGPIKVVEIAPPAVDTDLGGAGKHTFGVDVDEFADAVFARLEGEELEIAYGFAEATSRASRAEADAIFQRLNANPRA